MFQQFVNRGPELALLDELYYSPKAEFLITYGRRRVGKTELALRFAGDKKSLYFLAEERRDLENLRELQGIMGAFLQDKWFAKTEIKNWAELLRLFSEKIQGKKIILIIDEFPYLVKHNPGVPSAFQKAWDMHLKNKNVMLVLIGSSISMMEELLGYKSPLYGRRTAQLEVKPLGVFHIRDFLPGYNAEDLIKVFSSVGGIPFYLERFDAKKDFFENIEDLFLFRGRFLYEEAEFLLKQEFREPANYFSILKAISFGYTRYGEIVSYTQLDKTMVSKYLDNLARVRVIRKSHPIISKKEKTRDKRYEISDPYYRFWFKFIYPNKTLIEENRGGEVLEGIKRDINAFIGPAFEEVAKEFLAKLSMDGLLSPNFSKLGRWWHREEEIDLVAPNEETKEITFFEVKWSRLTKREVYRILDDLKRKAKLVKWHNRSRRETFGIMAKKIVSKEDLREEGYLAYDLEDLEALIP